jgi:type IV secretory pathway VirB2 component (pilin)
LEALGKFLPFLVLAVLFITPVAQAIDFEDDISDDDKATFDKILEPVLKVYNLVKYAASVIAVLVLLFAGITYMTSGSDPRKRDNAKNMATYVVIGLFVIWAAPMVVNFVI